MMRQAGNHIEQTDSESDFHPATVPHISCCHAKRTRLTQRNTAMKLLFRYLIASGVATHLVFATVAVHFRLTGLTPHRYVQKAIQVLDRDSSPTRHIASAARLVLLDSGLIVDPIAEFPPDLTTQLPQWRGIGASALRQDTAPRYSFEGIPIATTDRDLWALRSPPTMHTVAVDSVEKLQRALKNASAGDAIILKPGTYRISERLVLGTDGTPDRPLVLRGEDVANTVLELDGNAGLQVSGKYWTLSDLIVRGQCGQQQCPKLVDIGSRADAFTVRNLFVTGLQSLMQVSAIPGPTVPGLVDGVTLVGVRVAEPSFHWPQRAVREVDIPGGDDGFLVICAEKHPGPGCDGNNLPNAVKKLADGGLLLMRTGTYEQAATLRKRNLHLLAEPGAALRRASTQGKGALVVDASVTIEGLECSDIKVGDGNGCCLRQQQGDVTLLGVHFHHSQMGLLTGHNGGDIEIFDSYFHDSGHDESGQLGHNIYVNSGNLEFVRSWSLAARNAGHELKSRAARTTIADSLIASLNARDSRLIDIPNAGVLDIRGSVLGEGPRSENWEIIGYGLELKSGKVTHPVNSIRVRGNTIYVDRPQGANLLNAKHASSIDFTDNTIIGSVSTPPGNIEFDDREEAGVAAYPALDPKTF